MNKKNSSLYTYLSAIKRSVAVCCNKSSHSNCRHDACFVLQLRERMALLRIERSESEEEKRDRILATKQAKDEALMDTLATISRHRTENSKAAACRCVRPLCRQCDVCCCQVRRVVCDYVYC